MEIIVYTFCHYYPRFFIIPSNVVILNIYQQITEPSKLTNINNMLLIKIIEILRQKVLREILRQKVLREILRQKIQKRILKKASGEEVLVRRKGLKVQV